MSLHHITCIKQKAQLHLINSSTHLKIRVKHGLTPSLPNLDSTLKSAKDHKYLFHNLRMDDTKL